MMNTEYFETKPQEGCTPFEHLLMPVNHSRADAYKRLRAIKASQAAKKKK